MSSIYGIYQLAGGRGGAERHRCHHTADFQVVTSCVRPGGVLPKKGGKGHTDSSSDTYRRRSMGVIEENKKKESLDYA